MTPAPGERRRRRRARPGPGFASSVTSASGASPNRSRTRDERRDPSPGSSDGVPPPRYSDVERRPARGPGGPNALSSASARRPSSASSAASEPVERRLRGPRAAAPAYDHEVAVRADRDAERDVDVERGGWSRRRDPGGATSSPAIGLRRSPPLPRADDPPAVRRAAAAFDVLPLAPAERDLAGVARAQEDREPGDRVAQERGPDATGPCVSQPPVSPISRARTSM